MKKILVAVSVLSMSFVLGCGPSLKEYVGQSQTYFSRISTTASPTVTIEGNNIVPQGRSTLGRIGGLINTASAVTSVVLSSEQNDRIQKIVDPTVLATNVAYGFDSNFAGATHLQSRENATEGDIQIMMTIESYGLWSQSLTSPMNFFLEADIRIVYMPEMKTIYRNGVSLMREAANAFSKGAEALASNTTIYRHTRLGTVTNVTALVSGAANLTAFFELTDEDIAGIFDYMAVDAGSYIANELVEVIYD